MQTLVSWNVNGVRAVQKKGFLEWLESTSPDILCIQETKAQLEQLDEALAAPAGYHAYWVSAEKKGYSGVATFSKTEPLSVTQSGRAEFDSEGRVQILEYPDFHLINAYFPNSQAEGKRLDYKLSFCQAIFEICESLRSAGKNVIVCGDFNIAHKPIDLKNPQSNQKNPGYLPEERDWMDQFTSAGYLDTFRLFNQEPGQYTWWSYRFRAREKDIGWRIDYHCTNPEFRDRIQKAEILKDVMGSDHCPVTLQIS
jgi:exodeoxyribonuclease-3